MSRILASLFGIPYRKDMLETVDCVVVGAGVVGLACARRLAQAGREVIILEAEDLIGSHKGSRNSEVIHAGIAKKKFKPPKWMRQTLKP